MDDWDEWLVELERTTGLSAEQIVDVVQATDPAFAAIRAQRLREEEAAERRRQQIEGETKSLDLLRRHVTDEQWAQYEAGNGLDVVSSAGRQFTIANGAVYLNENGRRTVSYCIHVSPNFRVPPADNTLALKLLLEHDEPEFLRIAHASVMR